MQPTDIHMVRIISSQTGYQLGVCYNSADFTAALCASPGPDLSPHNSSPPSLTQALRVCLWSAILRTLGLEALVKYPLELS